MCGLVAIINKKPNGFWQKHVDIFKTLLYIDALRGEDSTGAFVVDNVGNVKIAKEASIASDFIGNAGFRELAAGAISNGFAMVGHNRKATRGTINDENAHPFWVEDKLVLVHNGTMYGDHKKHADVEVDSHAIAHILAEEPDVSKALKKINAAYALIWYDVENRRLHFMRNSQRPLFWMEGEDAFYVSSEQAMLLFVAERHDIKPQGKNLKINEFPEHHLNSWSYEDNTWRITTSKLDCEYVAPPQQQQQHHGHNNYRGYYDHGESCEGYWDNGRFFPAGCGTKQEASQPEQKPLTTLYPWSKPVTFSEWRALKESHYPRGGRIKVAVDDYIDGDDIGRTAVYLSGKTTDDKQAMCFFPVSKVLFDEITNPKALVSGVFEVEVEQVSWRPASAQENKDVEAKSGYMTIRGSNPVLVLDNNGVGVQ